MQSFFETPQLEHYILNYIDIIHDDLILVNNNYRKTVEESDILTHLNILINNMKIPNDELLDKSMENGFIDLSIYISHYLFSKNRNKLNIAEAFKRFYEGKKIHIMLGKEYEK